MATPFDTAQAAQAQQAQKAQSERAIQQVRGPKAPDPVSQGMRTGMARAAASRAGAPGNNQMTGMGTPAPGGGLTGIRAPGAAGGVPLPGGVKGPPPQGMGGVVGNALGSAGAGAFGGLMGGQRPPPPVSPVINQGMARAAASRMGGPPGQMTGMGGAPVPQYGGWAKQPNTMPSAMTHAGIPQDRGSFGQSFQAKAATPWGSGMFPVR